MSPQKKKKKKKKKKQKKVLIKKKKKKKKKMLKRVFICVGEKKNETVGLFPKFLAQGITRDA